ncbi:MAG TPA: ATP-binding protein [Acidimicrobiales bacterium]|jgi:signal transduction histidine kinase
MSVVPHRLAKPSWLRLPRRTARLRLTGLYSVLFLLSGVALVAVTYVLFERATEYKTPPLPKVPHTPSIQGLQLLPDSAAGNVVQTLPKQQLLYQAQQGLSQVQHELATAKPPGNLIQPLPYGLAHVQSQLTAAQKELAQGQRQLANAVHQLQQVGPAQAAQRAADSHQLLVNSGIALAIVAVLALLAGWFIAGRMLRPIRTITRTARRISSTNLHERLALGGPEDELKELGDTLDDLFGRLGAAFDAQRHFVANASHELRTPLTAERTLLQVALDDPDTTAAAWRSTAKEVLASTDEQAHLIEALLTLASSEGGLVSYELVELDTTVTQTLVDLQPEIDRLGIHVDVVTSPAPLEGDPRLVERLVVNLLSNALHHNVVGGRVEVTTGITDGQAVLSVTNGGPPIQDAEIDRLFQPFQRLETRRAHYKDGHGLGLSIVRAIATAHGATITARPLPDGGLWVSVLFAQPAIADGLSGESHDADGRRLKVEVASP